MKENLSQASIEPLLDYFTRLIPLNKEEKELVTEKFHPRLYRKSNMYCRKAMYALKLILWSGVVCECIK